MLDDVALFVHIVRAGGLAAAGATLGLPPATVTRRLARLEDQLGCKLIHRSARRFEVTSDGRAVFETVAGPIQSAELALASIRNDLSQMAGPLRVSAPTNLSLSVLEPMWSRFVAAHPDIRLDMRLSNARVDLEALGVDLAIRIGPQPDSGFHQVRLGRIRTAIVAAPAYLAQAGHPETPQALQHHRIIGVQSLPKWLLRRAGTDRPQELHLIPSISADDVTLATKLVVEGHGLSLLPISELQQGLRAGQLVTVLPEWRGPDRDVYLVWPTGRLMNARAKALKAHIEAFSRAVPLLQDQDHASGCTPQL